VVTIEAFEYGVVDMKDFYITGDDYRYRIEVDAKRKDFQPKYEKGKLRIFLKHREASRFIVRLNACLNRAVTKQRRHKFGSRSKIRTVIREDVDQLARYIRGALLSWTPTILSAYGR